LSLCFRFSDWNFVCIFDSAHSCYVFCPSRLPWFVHSGDIWWRIPITNHHSMQFSPPFCCLFFSRSKYSPQLPVLRHSACICSLPLMWETKFHVHTKQELTLSIFIYWCLIQIFRQDKGRLKVLNWMVASIYRNVICSFNSTLNDALIFIVDIPKLLNIFGRIY
jgi:hypothetical protein